MSTKVVYVTGCLGFIGFHVTQACLTQGWYVIGVDKKTYAANTEFLLAADMLALEDHPDDQEIVNGVCMNQGTYAMALVQSLSDLDAKAKTMADKGFYDSWPEEYLEQLFQHREDPRK